MPFGEIKQLTNESRDWIILKLEFLLAFDTDLRKVRTLVKEISKQLEADPELGHALLEPIKSQGVRRMEPTGMVIGLKIVAKPGSEVYLYAARCFSACATPLSKTASILRGHRCWWRLSAAALLSCRTLQISWRRPPH